MTTIIRDIDFGPIWGGSGVENFFGEGYWMHKLRKLGGMSFDGMTFVAKTTTLYPRDPDHKEKKFRAGNLPLNPATLQPREWFPKSITVDLFRKITWNAVGLTGPGAEELFLRGEWQKRTKPFFLSFMSVAETRKERLKELKDFCNLLKRHFFPQLKDLIGLQINLSCPNQKNDPSALFVESVDVIEIASTLGIPIILKYSIATAPYEEVAKLEGYEHLDGICVSNTIPANWEGIPWKEVCGSDESPLKDMGGGGFSGPIMVQLVTKYIHNLRQKGFTKHINGGGGIRRPADVKTFFNAGADSVFIASAGMVPFNDVNGIIRTAHEM